MTENRTITQASSLNRFFMGTLAAEEAMGSVDLGPGLVPGPDRYSIHSA